MDKLLELLKSAAPALATAAAGPMGGLAVKIIADKFDVENDVKAVMDAIATDPDATSKLAEIDLRLFELHNANTDSARNMNVKVQESGNASNLSKNAAYIIDFIIVGAAITLAWFAFFKGVPQENKELVYMALGSLFTMCGTVVNFHRGSSQGSKDKASEIQTIKGRA